MTGDRTSVRRGPLLALGAVLAVTALWWALALWPPEAGSPAWLERARLACFGASDGGLPDAAGWTALLVQPAVMLGALAVIWGGEIAAGLRALARSGPGRAGLVAVGAALAAGTGLAALRIHSAAAAPGDGPAVVALQAAHQRIDRPAPPLDLIDERARRFDLAGLRGRTIFVTFAFGHCETVCPRLVSDALAARRALPDAEPVVVVVTLDPWRDTPARLPRIAAAWGLDAGARLLGGPVDDVNRALDVWEVPRSRDPRTGDIVHAPTTYVVDPAGRVAYRTRGDAGTLIRLAEEL